MSLSAGEPITTHELREPVLAVEEVSLTLGGNLILRDVNIELRDIVRPGMVTGQIVALLGPSGVGKSQLFLVMAGLVKPDRGSVLIGAERTPVRVGMVGMVSQHYTLFRHRTVLGNLLVAGRQAGLERAACRAKANELLTRFELIDRQKFYPTQLSGGQRQRVAIAQQFMSHEHLLLMDEPFSGLDPVAVDRVSRLISEVANLHEHNTVILVSHDISAAAGVADTLLLLGRDRDATGAVIPGARIQEQYNLAERGLAWRPGIATDPRFLSLYREIRERFETL